MQTTIYLGNRRVQVLQGSAGSRAAISRVIEYRIEDDCLINGVIVDAEALTDSLRRLWQSQNLPKKGVRLVLGSGQFLTRVLQAPRLSRQQMLTLVSREFADADRSGDVVDYMSLRARPGETGETVLCCAAQRQQLQSYLEVFGVLGVSLQAIVPELAAQARLIEAMPVFADRTCILLNLDGDTMLGTLIEQGRYKHASRTRLFQQAGTPERAEQIVQTVSGLMQFQIADKRDSRITEVYLGDCRGEMPDILEKSIRALGAETAPFPAVERIRFPAGGSLQQCLLTAGDFIRR